MADKGYVFVSYSSTDRIFVNKIVEELKNNLQGDIKVSPYKKSYQYIKN